MFTTLYKEIPTLNKGGCIHYASIMHTILQEQGIKHKVLGIRYTDNEYPKPTDKDDIDYMWDYAMYKCHDHYFIQVGDMYFDGHGEVDVLQCCGEAKIVEVTESDLELHQDIGIWNYHFDPEIYLPILKEEIQNYICTLRREGRNLVSSLREELECYSEYGVRITQADNLVDENGLILSPSEALLEC